MGECHNVLIPDGDSTWALSVLHCLSQVKGYKFFILSNSKRTPTKFSKYTSYYKYYERPDDDEWLTIINSEIASNNISVVLPIAEQEARFFIKHRDSISKDAKVIALPQLETFEMAIHKNQLSDFAQLHNIPHPKSFYITSESEKSEALKYIQFPILIKPQHQKGGDGIMKVSALEEFPELNGEALFIQEYIEGYDIDCSVLCLNGKVLTHTIQKGNLLGSTTYAPQLGFDFVYSGELLILVENIMNKLNWSGIAHLDMRYDSLAKNYKLIEINARFWGSIDASRVAGVNFPHQLIRLAFGESIDIKTYRLTSYMRLKGVIMIIKRNPFFIFKGNYLLKNTEVKLFLKDPLPTLYRFTEWLGRQF